MQKLLELIGEREHLYCDPSGLTPVGKNNGTYELYLGRHGHAENHKSYVPEMYRLLRNYALVGEWLENFRRVGVKISCISNDGYSTGNQIAYSSLHRPKWGFL